MNPIQNSKFKIHNYQRLLIVVAMLAFVPAVGGVSHAQVEQGRLVVDAQEAEPHFPDTIRFTLKAHGLDARSATLRYQLVGQQATRDLDAEVRGGPSSLASDADLDLSLHYIPPGAQVAYYWTLTAESGESVNTPTRTFTLLDERFAWESLTDSDKHVSVHWYGGSDNFGHTLLTTASSALNRIEQKLDARLKRPANVWVYTKEADFHGALPP